MSQSFSREIATKVLGAKMLQGYSLLDKQCEKCGMPTMEYMGNTDCVVCPALVKKAKKKLKAQKKLEKESTRLEAQISLAKASVAKDIEAAPQEEEQINMEESSGQPANDGEEVTLDQQNMHLEVVKREKERQERESADRELRTLREKEAEQNRKLSHLSDKCERMSYILAEQARSALEAAQAKELEAQKLAEQAAQTARMAEEEHTKFEEFRHTKPLEEQLAAAKRKRQEIELKIAEDAKLLEDMEHYRQAGLATALQSMNRDVLVAENRRRLEAKAALDLQITGLEQDIKEDELETKTLSNTKRAEDEERIISLLEQDAEEKAKAAEEAIRRAKAALEHVHSARRESIAQTIAMAEQEVVAETEDVIKKEREDYKAPVILPSSSDIASEQWETLRTEGRAIMTRRVMAGWVLLAEFCKGAQCHSSPLIAKGAKKECVVCGGCGNGMDGAYITVDDFLPVSVPEQPLSESSIARGSEATTACSSEATSPTAHHTTTEMPEDFESKRSMVSKEIGKRMVDGWTLLDVSCPTCIMPLMMDTTGKSDICVLCGVVATMKPTTDGMTIKTADVPTKTLNIPVERARDLVHAMETMTMASHAQTKTYNDDAETMYTTIASTKDERSLADSIRKNAQRQLTTPRHDPPSSANAEKTEKRLEPAAVAESLANQSPELNNKSQPFSASALSAMIMHNTSGNELAPSMPMEELKDFVQAFMERNLDTMVSDDMREEVAAGIESIMNGDRGVINLEDTSFNFDMVGSDEYSANRQPPTPDSASRARGGTPSSRRGVPPRPDFASRSSPRRTPRTPNAISPRHGGFIYTGGPSDVTSLGEMSRAESVATDALDTILDRIDAAKATLLRDDVTIQEQLAAASLIEKLAQAAVAVKAMEKMDHI